MRGQVLVILGGVLFFKEAQLIWVDSSLFGRLAIKLISQISNLFSKKGNLLEQLFVICFECFDISFKHFD
jgi:uncharacterized membrane-anchored protein